MAVEFLDVFDGRIHDCNMKTKSLKSGLVFRDGKPVAVILEIEEYQKLLERLEDSEDLKLLEDMRKKPLKFKPLEEFIEEYSPDCVF
ncbi:MAG: type II toxin-antitoxin system Phd/YefM family antitoxin [Gammaproteobacteria bacterium]